VEAIFSALAMALPIPLAVGIKTNLAPKGLSLSGIRYLKDALDCLGHAGGSHHFWKNKAVWMEVNSVGTSKVLTFCNV
jgi:thioester reductase-like protein